MISKWPHDVLDESVRGDPQDRSSCRSSHPGSVSDAEGRTRREIRRSTRRDLARHLYRTLNPIRSRSRIRLTPRLRSDNRPTKRDEDDVVPERAAAKRSSPRSGERSLQIASDRNGVGFARYALAVGEPAGRREVTVEGVAGGTAALHIHRPRQTRQSRRQRTRQSH